MSPLDTIKSPIAKDLEQFNKIFDSTLHSSDPTLGKIFSAIGERKGKLMRPILLLLVARELGEVSQATFLSAVTLEMLHTASLIHDDVVDESDERRGHASIGRSRPFVSALHTAKGDKYVRSRCSNSSLNS